MSVAAICHKSWGSRPEATSLPPSILLSVLPSRELPRDLRRAHSAAAIHFDAIYAVKQPCKIHTDIKMYYQHRKFLFPDYNNYKKVVNETITFSCQFAIKPAIILRLHV